MLIILVFNYVKLNKNILSQLYFKDNEINILVNSNYKNLIAIKKMLKQSINKFYDIFKFDVKILKRFEEENENKETEKYNEIVIPKIECINEINEDYLKKSIVEGNKKFNDLLKDLE
jgi:hypothetical protein